MCMSVHILCLFSPFRDSSVSSVSQDESSSDRGGQHSDDECWDTPPPKPPRIRRWAANLKVLYALNSRFSLWKQWKFPHYGTNKGLFYLYKVSQWATAERRSLLSKLFFFFGCFFTLNVYWTVDFCCCQDGSNQDQDIIKTRGIEIETRPRHYGMEAMTRLRVYTANKNKKTLKKRFFVSVLAFFSLIQLHLF